MSVYAVNVTNISLDIYAFWFLLIFVSWIIPK